MISFFSVKKNYFIIILLLLSLLVNIFFIFNPLKIKSGINTFIRASKTMTLQRLEGTLLEHDLKIRVTKTIRKNVVYLNFKSMQPDGSYKIINSLKLKGSREAYFLVGQKNVNQALISLMLLDVTGDGFLDILAPTFNKFLTAHLNVARYNPINKKFELAELKNSQPIIPRK